MTTPSSAAADRPGQVAAPAAAAPAPEAPRPRRSPARLLRRVVVLALLGAAAYGAWKYPAEVGKAWRSLSGTGPKAPPAPPAEAAGPAGPWDGSLRLTEAARAALDVQTVEVKPQVRPIRLELLGTTEYISDTLTKVRPMFKGRVDKVHATVGQSVKKGEPLIDLYSTELAEAKSVYEIERIQWLYDKKLVEIRGSLLQSKTVSQQLYDETKNNEMKNHQEYEVARDKLLVYGLSDEDVERAEKESGSQKARLTLRSPGDGLVISRDVAVGNLYDENDTLLVIAPLDRLWVWGNVFESDLGLVRLGQDWEIQFPFRDQKVLGKVEYISNRVDPATHAVRIRTSIPNADGEYKSDMLVRGMLAIPPVSGYVVAPRTALVVGDGRSHVYVQAPDDPGRFERRSVSVAQETDDRAVIAAGLKAGEKVANVGALILAQMYEDLQTVATGAAATASPEAN
ncbi:efflux RND transporter periplasmic adaptor subunit [Paludisphaera mucosa]|uniref:Efflux RND transporter periplasmic adaptor subunit n=1 Tax=Paludisphaera mucosa TaxID=3030827 RepID=A0ABT6FKS4_9BACT|nr:efflux RND transporter periplasmic adaptor subunit [Paludisphaera mucosa]MDG3008164.1 efflux RND transporter periplasmic adaptor subunit [Paludisphaera mucosa]